MTESRQRVGPHSQRIAMASLDGRGVIARQIKRHRQLLIEGSGGHAACGPAKLLLATSAATRAVRMEMLMNEILEGTASTEDERHYLWHCNGLRRDLMALAAIEKPKKQSMSLEDYLEKIVDVEGSVASDARPRSANHGGHDDLES